MVTTSLDKIVRNVLLRKGYPIHYYMQALLYSKDCLRQLVEDDLQIVNTQIMPVDQTTNMIDIPSDYLDYIVVGLPVGQSVKPLVESDSLNELNNYDSNFQPTTYRSTTANSNGSTNALYGPYGFTQWFVTHYNNFGENTGRFAGGIAYNDTFKIIKKLNKIKINEALSVTNIVIVYISDGMNSNTATLITPYAQDCIEAYILWQFKEQNRTYGLGERKVAEDEYINQRRILRARLSDVNMQVLKRIVHRNSIASPKQ